MLSCFSPSQSRNSVKLLRLISSRAQSSLKRTEPRIEGERSTDNFEINSRFAKRKRKTNPQVFEMSPASAAVTAVATAILHSRKQRADQAEERQSTASSSLQHSPPTSPDALFMKRKALQSIHHRDASALAHILHDLPLNLSLTTELLLACVHSREPECAHIVLNISEKKGVAPSAGSYSLLIRAYCSAGRMEEALAVALRQHSLSDSNNICGDSSNDSSNSSDSSSKNGSVLNDQNMLTFLLMGALETRSNALIDQIISVINGFRIQHNIDLAAAIALVSAFQGNSEIVQSSWDKQASQAHSSVEASERFLLSLIEICDEERARAAFASHVSALTNAKSSIMSVGIARFLFCVARNYGIEQAMKEMKVLCVEKGLKVSPTVLSLLVFEVPKESLESWVDKCNSLGAKIPPWIVEARREAADTKQEDETSASTDENCLPLHMIFRHLLQHCESNRNGAAALAILRQVRATCGWVDGDMCRRVAAANCHNLDALALCELAGYFRECGGGAVSSMRAFYSLLLSFNRKASDIAAADSILTATLREAIERKTMHGNALPSNMLLSLMLRGGAMLPRFSEEVLDILQARLGSNVTQHVWVSKMMVLAYQGKIAEIFQMIEEKQPNCEHFPPLIPCLVQLGHSKSCLKMLLSCPDSRWRRKVVESLRPAEKKALKTELLTWGDLDGRASTLLSYLQETKKETTTKQKRI